MKKMKGSRTEHNLMAAFRSDRYFPLRGGPPALYNCRQSFSLTPQSDRRMHEEDERVSDGAQPDGRVRRRVAGGEPVHLLRGDRFQGGARGDLRVKGVPV